MPRVSGRSAETARRIETEGKTELSGRTRVTACLRAVGMWSEVIDIDSYFRHVARSWQFVHNIADSAGWRVEQGLLVLSDTNGTIMLSEEWRDTRS